MWEKGMLFDDEFLGAIPASISDVETRLGIEGAGAEDFSAYGTGFSVADKSTLVGVPLLFLQWRFIEGNMGEFAAAHVITGDGRKVVIVDGSTGIRDQLMRVTATRIKRGQDSVASRSALKVKGGLRRSDYQFDDGSGKMKDATTFYLAE